MSGGARACVWDVGRTWYLPYDKQGESRLSTIHVRHDWYAHHVIGARLAKGKDRHQRAAGAQRSAHKARAPPHVRDLRRGRTAAS